MAADTKYEMQLEKNVYCTCQLSKMTIMPRFLFLLQAIPVFIPKSFFKDLNKHISTFIWNKKVPRIQREYLERQRGDGDLSLPNFCIITGQPTFTS